MWRAKADRFDRFAAKRWVRFVLPLLGLPLAFKSQRAQQPAAPKSGASGRGRLRAATGDAAGEASEGDPVMRDGSGLKQPDTSSRPIVQTFCQPANPGARRRSRRTIQRSRGGSSHSAHRTGGQATLPERLGRRPSKALPQLPAIAQPDDGAFARQGRRVHRFAQADKATSRGRPAWPRRSSTRATKWSSCHWPARFRNCRKCVRRYNIWKSRFEPFVRDLDHSLPGFLAEKQKNYREKRDAEYQAAVAKGGLRALALRLGRAAKAPVRPAAGLSWRLFVVTPSALLLKKPSQRFCAEVA